MLTSLATIFGKYPAHELIIGGYFIGLDGGDPSKKVSIAWFKAESGVVAIHHELHPGPFPSTYSRGTRRIDQVYVSQRLVAKNLILLSTIGGYDSLFPSDHRPLTIGFDAARFFDANDFQAVPRSVRILRSNDPQLTQPYFSHVSNGVTSQKLDKMWPLLPNGNGKRAK